MKTPHKHAELIKAWADGAEIEARSCSSLARNEWGKWCTVSNPEWYPHQEYRIKPEPKPDVVVEWLVGPREVTYFDHAVRHAEKNLKLTFDGDTGKLKLAEVL